MVGNSKAKLSKYSLLSYLYFFFNCAGLPGGLLYTNILSPVFYIWIVYQKKQPVLYQFFLVLIPFNIIHLLLGVQLKSFLISNLLFLSTYIFVVCFYYFINNYSRIGRIYKNILLLNFLFMLLALLLLFTPFRELLWYKNKFTQTVEDFYRLSLLTFEASYYSLLFAPVSIYFLLKIFFKQYSGNATPILLMSVLPLILSLSLGVIGGMLFSFGMMFFVNWQKVFYKRNFLSVLVVIIGVCILTILTSSCILTACITLSICLGAGLAVCLIVRIVLRIRIWVNRATTCLTTRLIGVLICLTSRKIGWMGPL